MPRCAGRSQSLKGALLLLAVALAHPAWAQAPAPGDKPTVPGQPPVTGEKPTVPAPPPPATPTPTAPPIPVIPEVQPIGPPPTVPSAPQRVLPPTTVGLPVTATFQFEPSVSLIEEYSDNFNLTKSDKKSNFRSTLSPGLRLGINSPLTKGLIGLTFAPSYDTTTEDVSFFYSLLGQIVWQANPRWQLTVADTLTRSDQVGEADRLGLRQQRQTFTTNIFALNSDYQVGTVATQQSYRLSTFSDESGSDTTTHVLAANASVPLYQTNLLSAGYEYLTSETSNGVSSLGTPTATGTATGEEFAVRGHQLTATASRQLYALRSVGLKTSYALRTTTSGTGDIDYQLWSASVFTRYALPGRLTLDGSLGLSGLTIDGGQSVGPNFSTTTSISYQFARALMSLALDRGFSETFSDGENFGVVETEGITGSLAYTFTPTLVGTASAFYRSNKTTGIANQTGGNDESTNWGGSLTFSWRIQRGLQLDLTYTHFEQVGTDNGGGNTGGNLNTNSGYAENRVQAALRVSF